MRARVGPAIFITKLMMTYAAFTQYFTRSMILSPDVMISSLDVIILSLYVIILSLDVIILSLDVIILSLDVMILSLDVTILSGIDTMATTAKHLAHGISVAL